MSLLTQNDIAAIASNTDTSDGVINFARAIEAAVIARLATVSVEPDLIKTDEVDRYGDSIYIEAYSAEALAAARVQVVNAFVELVKQYNGMPPIGDELAQAFIGGKE